MTTPGHVKKLIQQFGSPSSAPGGAPDPTPKPTAQVPVPGLAQPGWQVANQLRTNPGELAAEEQRKRTFGPKLAEHLVATGRANAPDPSRPKGTLGGARTPETEARAEKSAGKVLEGIEKGTQQSQQAADPGAPLAHAVSAHGPGSDQIGRVLHGRRAEEIKADQLAGTLPQQQITLSSNGRTDTVHAYDTVGSQPSNSAGSFNSNQAMLHMVGEAFARADAFSRAATPAPTAPTSGPKPAKDPFAPSALDDNTFVTEVGGRGTVGDRAKPEVVGENLEVKGFLKQKESSPGDPEKSIAPHSQGLAKDEMALRHAAIERTDATSGRFVLRPATGAGGKRAGWQMQTAYPAGTPAADPTWSAPYSDESLKSSKFMHENAVAIRKRDVETMDKSVRDLEKELKDANGSVKSLTAAIKGAEQGEKNGPAAIAKAQAAVDKKPGNAELQKKLEEATARYDDVRQRLPVLRSELAKATAAVPQISDSLNKAKAAKLAATKALKDAQDELTKNHGAPAPKAATAEQTAEARITVGYNPATGRYEGDRPSKPDDTLKGKDEKNAALTAHHIYPWNKLRDQLNEALTGGDRGKLEALFSFGGVELAKILPPGQTAEWFWTELAKDSKERTYLFSDVINRAAPLICWTPRNIFMGPSGETRGDDPGEELDAIFAGSGLPTPASAVGELVAKSDGFGQSEEKPQIPQEDMINFLSERGKTSVRQLTNDELRQLEKLRPRDSGGRRRLANMLMKNRTLGDNAGPREYDQSEWQAGKKEGKDVKTRRGVGESTWSSDAGKKTLSHKSGPRRDAKDAWTTALKARADLDQPARAEITKLVAELRKVLAGSPKDVGEVDHEVAQIVRDHPDPVAELTALVAEISDLAARAAQA